MQENISPQLSYPPSAHGWGRDIHYHIPVTRPPRTRTSLRWGAVRTRWDSYVLGRHFLLGWSFRDIFGALRRTVDGAFSHMGRRGCVMKASSQHTAGKITYGRVVVFVSIVYRFSATM